MPSTSLRELVTRCSEASADARLDVAVQEWDILSWLYDRGFASLPDIIRRRRHFEMASLRMACQSLARLGLVEAHRLDSERFGATDDGVLCIVPEVLGRGAPARHSLTDTERALLTELVLRRFVLSELVVTIDGLEKEHSNIAVHRTYALRGVSRSPRDYAAYWDELRIAGPTGLTIRDSWALTTKGRALVQMLLDIEARTSERVREWLSTFEGMDVEKGLEAIREFGKRDAWAITQGFLSAWTRIVGLRTSPMRSNEPPDRMLLRYGKPIADAVTAAKTAKVPLRFREAVFLFFSQYLILNFLAVLRREDAKQTEALVRSESDRLMIIMDTNVLVSLLAEADHWHGVSKATLQRMDRLPKDAGIEVTLAVTKGTLEEVSHYLRVSERSISASYRATDAAIQSLYKSFQLSPFVRDYIRAALAQSLDFRGYTHLVRRRLRELLEARRVLVVDDAAVPARSELASDVEVIAKTIYERMARSRIAEAGSSLGISSDQAEALAQAGITTVDALLRSDDKRFAGSRQTILRELDTALSKDQLYARKAQLLWTSRAMSLGSGHGEGDARDCTVIWTYHSSLRVCEERVYQDGQRHVIHGLPLTRLLSYMVGDPGDTGKAAEEMGTLYLLVAAEKEVPFEVMVDIVMRFIRTMVGLQAPITEDPTTKIPRLLYAREEQEPIRELFDEALELEGGDYADM